MKKLIIKIRFTKRLMKTVRIHNYALHCVVFSWENVQGLWWLFHSYLKIFCSARCPECWFYLLLYAVMQKDMQHCASIPQSNKELREILFDCGKLPPSTQQVFIWKKHLIREKVKDGQLQWIANEKHWDHRLLLCHVLLDRKCVKACVGVCVCVFPCL